MRTGSPTTTIPGARRCAYVLNLYPAPTHAFILNEIQAMRAAGVEVEAVSIRRAPEGTLLSAADREEFERTHSLLPTTPWRLLRSHARALRRGPVAYLRTLVSALRDTAGGPRAALWQLFYFAEAVLLWGWLEERGLRHVHVHHATPGDVVMLACRFSNLLAGGTPNARRTWSLTLHGPTDFFDAAGRKLRLKAESADAVICISDFGRGQLLSLLDGAAGERVHTVRLGVDVERFAAPPDAGAGGPPLRILTVAQLVPRKGIDVLLDALDRLRARDVEFEATIVGDGEQRGQLEARARELGLEAFVTFAGAVGQDEILEHLARADVFCLPSFAEGIPVVLMEAMARGLPVVATAVMGVPELVVDRRSGLLVPPARADLLADALAELAGDPALRAQLGREGRARVADEFELGRSVTELLRVLGPLIAEPRG